MERPLRCSNPAQISKMTRIHTHGLAGVEFDPYLLSMGALDRGFSLTSNGGVSPDPEEVHLGAHPAHCQLLL